MDCESVDCHHSAVHFSLFVLVTAAFVSLLTLAAGVVRYRKGDRWLLALLPLIPVGVVLGIYAGDHHERVLGIPAFLLIIAPVLIWNAARRDQPVATDC